MENMRIFETNDVVNVIKFVIFVVREFIEGVGGGGGADL